MSHAQRTAPSTAALAFATTRHCLTGCAIGEMLATGLSGVVGLSTSLNIVLGIALAFTFGYGLTLFPLLRGGMAFAQAAGVTLAGDTVSIVVMEIVDNLFVLLVPGAMEKSVSHPLYWGSLIVGLAIAFLVAYPLNKRLIERGRGAVVHGAH